MCLGRIDVIQGYLDYHVMCYMCRNKLATTVSDIPIEDGIGDFDIWYLIFLV